MRSTRTLHVAATLLACTTSLLPATASIRQAHAAPSPLTTIEYAGTFETTWPTATSTADPKGIPGDTAHAAIAWDAVAQITDAQLYNGEKVHWHYKKLEGSYDYVDKPLNGNPGLTCNEKLGEVAGYEQSAYDLVNVGYSDFTKRYTLYAATPFNNLALTTGLKPTDPCAAFAYWEHPIYGDAGEAALGAAMQPSASVPRGGPYVMRFSDTWRSPHRAATDSVNATVTISAGLSGLTPVRYTPVPGTRIPPSTPPEVRAHAIESFIALTRAGVAPCLATTAGILLLPSGPPGAAAGSLLLASAGQECVTVAEFMYLESKIIYDPPDRRYSRLAHVLPPANRPLALPSCSRWSGAARTLCSRLSVAIAGRTMALRNAEAVAQALATTIARESSAAAAHDSAALAAQQQMALQLDARETTALRAVRVAGANVAAIFRGAGLRWTLSGANTARGLSALLDAAARKGVSATRSASILGAQAPRGALDAEQVIAVTP